MAVTLAQLTSYFTNSNAGTAPTAAQTAALTGIFNQNATAALSDAAALQAAIDLGSDTTTAVSVQTYQYFLGFAPSQAGLAALNAAYVGTGSQAPTNGENRYLAQSISLALQNSTAKTAFAAKVGSLSMADAATLIYNEVVGSTAAAAAGINIASAVAFLTSSASISFYTAFVRANAGLGANPSAADVDLAVKAALVGEIIYNATIFNNGAGVGSYAVAANNLLSDLADDGVLTANNAAGINLFASYGSSPAAKSFSLTTGADTLVGGAGDDTFTALTVDATGATATTFSAFDSIDGGLGNDTLNVYNNGAQNSVFPTSGSVKNVETVNILNSGAASTTLANASNYTGVTALWQVGANAAGVSNLAATTTAGFRNTTSGVGVTPAAGVSSAKIAFDGVSEFSSLTVGANNSTAALSSVTITGSTVDTSANGVVSATNTQINLGKNVTTLTLSSTVDLSVNAVVDNGSNTGGATLTTFDASGSKGAIGYTAAATVTTVSTGAGADVVTFTANTVVDDAATAADETVTGNVSTGAGNDTLNINSFGTGRIIASTGDGNDTINIQNRSTNNVSGANLVITAGAGDDVVTMTNSSSIRFGSSSQIRDSIDAGDGVDTLSMSASVATTVSGTTTFENAISNFEKISIGAVANTENGVVDLANLDDISYVVSAGSNAAAGITEQAVVVFNNLLPGQSVTVGGATYTNSSNVALTAAQVATNFAAAYDLSGYTEVTSVAGQITYISTTANANITPNISASATAGAAAAAPSITVTDGVVPVTAQNEVSTVTFTGLLAGESTTVAGRSVTAQAVTESAALTFSNGGGYLAGYAVTVAGRTATVGVGGATGVEVAQALASGSTVGNVTISGSLNSNFTLSQSTNVLTATATVAGANVTDVTFSDNSGTLYGSVYTQGANGNLTATQVANAFATGNTAGGVALIGGAYSGWGVSAASGQSVTYTSTTAANVADLSTTVSTTSGSAQTISGVTQGVNNVSGVTENGTITFVALLEGQSANILGRIVTAVGGPLTAAQAADAWISGSSGNAVISGALSTGNWIFTNAVAGDASIEYQWFAANTNVTNFSGTSGGAVTPTAPAVTVTEGAVSFGNLTLNNMASGGTLEITAANGGVTTVNLVDTSGTADVLNLKINGSSNIVNNAGTIVVAGVETINITTADSDTLLDPTAASRPNLVAAAATAITVTGNHGVNFTGSTLGNLVSLNTSGVVSTLTSGASAAAAVTFASTVTGSTKTVTVTTGMGDDTISLSASNTKGGVISTGAGADTITGSGGNDTINAGDGNDIVFSSAGADTITLGAGKDSYKLQLSTHTVLATSDTITDFTANTLAQSTSSKGADTNIVLRTGDVIDVTGLFGGGATGIKVAIATSGADAQTIVQNISTNDGSLTGFVLDSSTGKLYMDFNDDGNVDSVITLTGVTTLTTAAFLTGL